MNATELPGFYEELVRKLRHRGVVCAITSGLACVHYGIAETTKDCDLLCHPGSFGEFVALLETVDIDGNRCRYRGNISPPLDTRWHRGGWTSHFEWMITPDPVTLDVFGHGFRQTSPWEEELLGLYAATQTVAEMKRSQRDKDWPFITALGLRMLEAGDDRGWLHLFEVEVLKRELEVRICPDHLASQRPALRMAMEGDPRTAGALNAERKFWEELDRRRARLFEKHLRPYVAAVRKARSGREFALAEDHRLRIDCAQAHLPENPLGEHGVARYLEEARAALVKEGLIPESGLTWLPDVREYFRWA